MEKKKKKKVKVVYVDDGRTIYDMSGVTRPGQILFPENKEKSCKEKEKNKKNERVGLTKAERWAVIKAAYAVYLPVLFGVIACFSLAAVLMYLFIR